MFLSKFKHGKRHFRLNERSFPLHKGVTSDITQEQRKSTAVAHSEWASRGTLAWSALDHHSQLTYMTSYIFETED